MRLLDFVLGPGCISATSAISGATRLTTVPEHSLRRYLEIHGWTLKGDYAALGAVLAKMALSNMSLTESASRCGEFALQTIIPTFAFYDFETFFSCNNKPVRRSSKHRFNAWALHAIVGLSNEFGVAGQLDRYPERYETHQYVIGWLDSRPDARDVHFDQESDLSGAGRASVGTS